MALTRVPLFLLPGACARWAAPLTTEPFLSLMPGSFDTAGQADDLRISITTAHEVRYWTKTLACTEPQLRAALAAVGPLMKAVRTYLRTPS